MGNVEVLSIRQEGDKVQIIGRGRLMMEMSWQSALEFAQAVITKARLAEEYTERERLARESALLLRAGLPPLSANPDILKRAHQIATYDLPKYMPDDKRRG